MLLGIGWSNLLYSRIWRMKMTDEELKQKLENIESIVTSLENDRGHFLIILVLIILLAKSCS